MLFSYGILLREPKAVYIHTPLVFYRQHETSACATLTKEAIRGDIEKVASRFVEILRRDNVPEEIEAYAKEYAAWKAKNEIRKHKARLTREKRCVKLSK